MNKIHGYKLTVCTDKSIMFDNILMAKTDELNDIILYPYYFDILINNMHMDSINRYVLHRDMPERYKSYTIDGMLKLFLKEKYKSGMQRR